MSMFEQIACLPLFQGVSTERISRLVEKIPFHFIKVKSGETIVTAGTRCEHMRFLVSGSIRQVYRFADTKVTVACNLNAPDVIGAEFLFGRNNYYPFDVIADNDAGLLLLTKRNYLAMINSDRIFLFNILNLLSGAAQRMSVVNNVTSVMSPTSKLKAFLSGVVPPGAVNIVVNYVMRDLCGLIGVSRQALMTALETLATDRHLTYDSNSIKWHITECDTVPDGDLEN